MNSSPAPVYVLINPVSGPPKPTLRGIATALKAHHLAWECGVTTKPEDIKKLVNQAVEDGFQTIAVYGGDGTVSQVASILAHTSAQLLILPGGTANVVAKELGMAQPVHQIFQQYRENLLRLRAMDTFVVNGKRGLIRVNVGVFSEQVARAKRQSKQQLGEIAYAATGITALRDSQPVTYSLEVDHTTYTYEGIGLMITNIANAGYENLSFSKNISAFDQKMDALVMTGKDLPSLLQFTAQTIAQDTTHIPHLIGSTFKLSVPEGQTLILDDKKVPFSEVSLQVDPGSLSVLVPQEDQ